MASGMGDYLANAMLDYYRGDDPRPRRSITPLPTYAALYWLPPNRCRDALDALMHTRSTYKEYAEWAREWGHAPPPRPWLRTRSLWIYTTRMWTVFHGPSAPDDLVEATHHGYSRQPIAFGQVPVSHGAVMANTSRCAWHGVVGPERHALYFCVYDQEQGGHLLWYGENTEQVDVWLVRDPVTIILPEGSVLLGIGS